MDMPYIHSNPKAYEEALADLARAEDLYNAALSGGDTEEARQRCLEDLASFVPPSIQEHWKSGNEPGVTPENDHWKFYVVKGLAWVDGTLKGKYAAFYKPESDDPPGHIFYRPLLDPREGFLVPINRPQWKPHPYVGPRFSLIRELTLEQCDSLLEEAAWIATSGDRAEALMRIEYVLNQQ